MEFMLKHRTFNSAIEFLSSLAALKLKFHSSDASLIRMRNLMNSLSLYDIFDQFSSRYVPTIHITGTKGKGSTSAFCESLLRHHGLHTGLYTSPHLRSVCERIRFNSISVSESLFSSAFFDILDRLNSIGISDIEHDSFPRYFEFITLVCFYLLEKIKPDIAIIEVGIGGLYDCTNIIPFPSACIITSIGMDHMERLGNSLISITQNKAGIIKPERNVWTTISHSPEVAQVIREYATKQNAPLHLVGVDDIFSSFIPLGISGFHQYENASLAVAACRYILNHSINSYNYNDSKILSSIEKLALRNTYWPGRCHKVMISSSLILYLDGAHTVESMEKCCEWWLSEQHNTNRILIFYVSNKRSLKDLFIPLKKVHQVLEFHEIYFTTLNAKTDDEWSLEYYKSEWNPDENIKIFLFPSIHDIIHIIRSKKSDVLVTGSFYLISYFYSHFDLPVDHIYKSE